MAEEGDFRAEHLPEAYLPGDVHYVDSRRGRRDPARGGHRCGRPLDVAHGGGV